MTKFPSVAPVIVKHTSSPAATLKGVPGLALQLLMSYAG